MNYKPAQSHYFMAILLSGTRLYYSARPISGVIWFLMISLLCRGQGQGKGTLKRKVVKFNTWWMKGASCEISLIKGWSVSVISGAKILHRFFPRVPSIVKLGSIMQITVSHSTTVKEVWGPLRCQQGGDSQQASKKGWDSKILRGTGSRFRLIFFLPLFWFWDHK